VNPRLMIIDDEEHIRTSLACFLEDFDEFEVRTAHSAELALEELRREPADLCVVDIRLPATNGAEFIRIAKERGLCPRHVLHTGSTDFQDYIDIEKLGMTANDVFQKPCDSMAILERIRQVLRSE
jgi:two-component system, OmpR family, response regulator